MIRNFIKNVVNSSLGCSGELLDTRQKAQTECGAHVSDPESYQLEVPVLPNPPTPPVS
ncbi:hypothetical protein DFH29DRAFT_1002723 [Suillus ampliporus]|nr:hypothetical protein DFH29DRAFT_1002723 [Suillus ampliporus]